jgi:lipopolysaccharide export system protein LptA
MSRTPHAVRGRGGGRRPTRVVGWLLLGGWACLAVISVARAQVPVGPVRGFNLPLVDRETFRLEARVRGDEALPLGDDRFEVNGVRLESYGAGDRTNLVVTTERCWLNARERRIESPEALEVMTGDGQLRLQGQGFSWSEADGLVISNRVEAALSRPGEGAPVGIRSDRLRYMGEDVVFEGGVELVDADGQLRADRLTFALRGMTEAGVPGAGETALTEQVEQIRAEGSVGVRTVELEAWAEQAEYDVGAALVHLAGQARWVAGLREGEAGEVWLDRKADRLTARGGVRVRLPTGVLTGGVSGSFPMLGTADPAAGGWVEVQSRELLVEPDAEAPGLQRAVFRDEVELARGGGRLRCPRLTVQYVSEEAGAAPSAVGGMRPVAAWADGGVKAWQGTNRVECPRMDYSAEAGVVELGTPVTWFVGGQSGRADRVTIDVLRAMTRARGAVRLRLPSSSMGQMVRVLGGVEPRDASEPGSGDGADVPVEVACEEVRHLAASGLDGVERVEFEGGVRVTRAPDTELQCRRMTLQLTSETRALRWWVADGGVEMTSRDARGLRRARGDRAEYGVWGDELRLTGSDGVEMELRDAGGTHWGRGELAVYDPRRDVLELRSGATVESVHGWLAGDEVRVDRSRNLLGATGLWRVRIPVRSVDRWVSGLDEDGGPR